MVDCRSVSKSGTEHFSLLGFERVSVQEKQAGASLSVPPQARIAVEQFEERLAFHDRQLRRAEGAGIGMRRPRADDVAQAEKGPRPEDRIDELVSRVGSRAQAQAALEHDPELFLRTRSDELAVAHAPQPAERGKGVQLRRAQIAKMQALPEQRADAREFGPNRGVSRRRGIAQHNPILRGFCGERLFLLLAAAG